MKNLLFLLFIQCTFLTNGQGVFVGDFIDDFEIDTTIISKEITSSDLTITEKNYKLLLDKEKVISNLKHDIKIVSKDYMNLYEKTIQYLSSNETVDIKLIWSNWFEEDTVSIFDENLTNEMLARIILKESICTEIRNGDFKLISQNKVIQKVYCSGVSSSYGGYARGYIAENKLLIWICPPFMM